MHQNKKSTANRPVMKSISQRIWTFSRAISVIACLASVLACTSFRHGYTTSSYKNQVLRCSEGPGAERLQLECGFDSVIDHWVKQKGKPDYIFVENVNEVTLLYINDDQVVHFERPLLSTRSKVSVLKGIPESLSVWFVSADLERLKKVGELETSVAKTVVEEPTQDIGESIDPSVLIAHLRSPSEEHRIKASYLLAKSLNKLDEFQVEKIIDIMRTGQDVWEKYLYRQSHCTWYEYTTVKYYAADTLIEMNSPDIINEILNEAIDVRKKAKTKRRVPDRGWV